MFLIVLENYRPTVEIKSASMREPGRTKQEVIQLKSLISLKFGTNGGLGE